MRVLRSILAVASTAIPALAEDPLEDLFAVHMVVSAGVTDGSLRPYVRVFHPYDRRPLPGVEVTATVEDHDFAATAMTDERGEAEIVLPVTEDVDSDGFTVVAVDRYRGQEREAEVWTFADLGAPRVILGTDKKLYRPGQRLYVRGLWLGHDGRPLAEQPVKLALEDTRGRVVFFAELVTSSFGVAATEWRIPPTAEEGTYIVFGFFEGIDSERGVAQRRCSWRQPGP